MAEYIEREALLEKAQNERIRLGYDIVSVRDIESMPAADVAPVRHGRWEQCFEDWRQQIEGDKCSVCGFEHYGAIIKKYKYCHCGCKMDLEE